MKIYIYYLLIILSIASCTKDVIIPSSKNVTPRLVIEANINLNKYNKYNHPQSIKSIEYYDGDAYKPTTQTIKLSKTTSYYNKNYPAVKGATISITDENGVSMGTFLDVNPDIPGDTEDGIYTATDFNYYATVGNTYFMKITVEGQTYTAQDVYTSIEKVNHIHHDSITIVNQETPRIRVNINNEIGVDNYYLSELKVPFKTVPEYNVLDDESYSEEPGRNNFDFNYIDDDLKKGMVINITLFGISKDYYNYLDKLFSIGSGGLFATVPYSVRGNILNTTNKDKNPLGYFSINQIIKIRDSLQ